MNAVESSLRLISFHMPALGRCNMISTGTGGSVTSKAVISSAIAVSITDVCSLGMGAFSNKPDQRSILRACQKTRAAYCRNAVRQMKPGFSALLPAFPADRSAPRRCHPVQHDQHDYAEASGFPATDFCMEAPQYTRTQIAQGLPAANNRAHPPAQSAPSRLAASA